jgi:hypothetical protein
MLPAKGRLIGAVALVAARHGYRSDADDAN